MNLDSYLLYQIQALYSVSCSHFVRAMTRFLITGLSLDNPVIHLLRLLFFHFSSEYDYTLYQQNVLSCQSPELLNDSLK